MKVLPCLLLLLLLIISCKKEVDPRDQYVATYKQDLTYASNYYITVKKGAGPNELRLQFDTDETDFMAKLSGSTFVIPRYERFYKDASGTVRSSGTVEGTGYFENKKIEFIVNTMTTGGFAGTNKIVAYRVN